MAQTILTTQTQVVAELLNDSGGFWFYYKAVKLLGFQKCFDLAKSISDKPTIRTTPARYFNGMVRREVSELGLTWPKRGLP